MEEEKTKEDKDQHFEHYEFLIDGNQIPMRVDKFLMSKMEGISRTKIQESIKAGKIKINHDECKPNEKIKPYDIVSVFFYKARGHSENLIPEDIPLNIVYEDNDLMVVNNPGIGNWTGTLVNALAYYMKGKNELPIKEGNTNERPGLVHRIDKDTSGLLVIAKTEEAMTHLSKQFYDHTIERKYLALVWGDIGEEKGTIEGHIGRHPSHRMMRTVFADGSEGKNAITHYEVLKRFYYVTLLQCQLETGRTHQIRVHMKHLGHPLFNDTKYGGDRIVKGTIFTKFKAFVNNTFKVMPRHALHAHSLGFIHPRTGEKMYFEESIPEDFENAITRWKNYVSSRKENM
jgi:23S rRNA pseudouridine1911/1915/1917 synthase